MAAANPPYRSNSPEPDLQRVRSQEKDALQVKVVDAWRKVEDAVNRLQAFKDRDVKNKKFSAKVMQKTKRYKKFMTEARPRASYIDLPFIRKLEVIETDAKNRASGTIAGNEHVTAEGSLKDLCKAVRRTVKAFEPLRGEWKSHNRFGRLSKACPGYDTGLWEWLIKESYMPDADEDGGGGGGAAFSSRRQGNGKRPRTAARSGGYKDTSSEQSSEGSEEEED